MDRYPDYDAIIDYHEGVDLPPAGDANTISVSEPVFLGREREYVLDCIDRRWLTQGHYVGRLEREFAHFAGAQFGIACSSGTSALHLAMIATGIEPGDVVLVPALSYIATANAVTYTGATPVFVDVDRRTWCMDPEDVRRKLARIKMALGNTRIAGAIAVHLYDSIADIDAIRDELPDEAWVVEDAAQAHGGRYGDRPVGSLGDLATFSFYGSKIIAAGEGGIVVTTNQVRADIARLYRGQGADRTGHYEHSVVGYNYRMTDLSAAIALAQLETYPEHRRRRTAIIDAYHQAVPAAIRGVEMQSQTINCQGGAWSTGIILPPGADRNAVAASMLEAGVETRPFFVPLHLTGAYAAEHSHASCAIACHVAGRGLTLPTHSAMTTDHVDRVVEALKDALK